MARHAQITQKEWWSWFFACRGAWRFPTNQYYSLIGMVKLSQSSQNSKFAMSSEKLGMKLILSLFQHFELQKFRTRSYYHYWWTWSSIFKVLKVTSLQYLYTISKKLGMEFIFYMQKKIKVSASWHYHCSNMSKVIKMESW